MPAEINLKFTALEEYSDHNFCNHEIVSTVTFSAILSLHESIVKHYLQLHIEVTGATHHLTYATSIQNENRQCFAYFK
jgi:hypothetical protein